MSNANIPVKNVGDPFAAADLNLLVLAINSKQDRLSSQLFEAIDQTNPGFIGFTYGTRTAGFSVGEGSFAIGGNNRVSGQYACAIGFNCQASGQYSIAMGRSAQATARNAISMGSGTFAGANNAVALGFSTSANNDSSFASGNSSVATGHSSHAMGYYCRVNAFAAHAVGLHPLELPANQPANYDPADPVYVIGCGSLPNGSGAPGTALAGAANAATVRKSGNMKLGKHIDPIDNGFAVEVCGSMKHQATYGTVFNGVGAVPANASHIVFRGGGATSIPAAATCPGRIIYSTNQSLNEVQQFDQDIYLDGLTVTRELGYGYPGNRLSFISEGGKWNVF